MGLVEASPPSPHGSLLSPRVPRSSANLGVQSPPAQRLTSGPAQSGVKPRLILHPGTSASRRSLLRVQETETPKGCGSSSGSLARLSEPLPPTNSPPPLGALLLPPGLGGNSHPCSSAHRLLRLLPSRCCLCFNFCVAVRKLPIITASETKHLMAQTLLPAVARLPRSAGAGLREPPSGSWPLPKPATLMRGGALLPSPVERKNHH